MSNEPKKLKIHFAPGCFDDFDGTQEELDALIAQLTEMFESGEAEAQARLVSVDDLMEDEDLTDDQLEQILGVLTRLDDTDDRKLH